MHNINARDISTNETEWHGTCRAESGHNRSGTPLYEFAPGSMQEDLCAVQEVAGSRDARKAGAAESREPSKIARQKLKWLFYAVPFLSGTTTPIAGALNVQARETCGSIYFTVAMTYSIDLILFGLWAHFTSKATLADNWQVVGTYVFGKPYLRWACLAGGVMGATQHIILSIVTAQGGSSIYTLGCLSGAILSGIVLDCTGFFWARKVRPNVMVLMGATTVIAGAVLHSLPTLRGGSSETSQSTMVMCLLISVLSGLLMCLQACAGNKLATLIGGFRRAAVWSFFSGALFMYMIGPYIVPGAPLLELLKPRNWWKLTQAPLAAFSLVAVAVCQRKMSGAMVYCWFVIGQLVSSTILDSFGWIGLVERPIDKYKIIGLLVVLIGVLTVTVSKLWCSQQQQSHLKASPSRLSSSSTLTSDQHQSCASNEDVSSYQRSSPLEADVDKV